MVGMKALEDLAYRTIVAEGKAKLAMATGHEDMHDLTHKSISLWIDTFELWRQEPSNKHDSVDAFNAWLRETYNRLNQS